MSIIEIENLSKKYIIAHKQRERYLALRDVISEGAKNIWLAGVNSVKRRFDHSIILPEDETREEFWALKDVNLEIKQGDRLGIIGRNGAGKSTLLKVLSRITEPSYGRISIKGRTASLLEVGTGFHPELTGRENIFLNGAILGMSRREIRRKFDEIIAFAEIEKFLDTPVKKYSSGMYVRLAFAVAAHLEPEILIVDEVLAVGDAQFQKKCLGKMEDVSAKEGRTVIFVSHNMNAIRRLCGRAILLNNGRIVNDGDASSVINNYLANVMKQDGGMELVERVNSLPKDNIFKLNSISLTQEDSTAMRFSSDKDIIVKFDYEVYEDKKNLFVNFELCDTDGNIITETFHNADGSDPVVRKGSYVSSAVIPANTLSPISYELRIFCGIFGDRNFHSGSINVMFEVFSDNIRNLVYSIRPLSGKVVLPILWDTKQLSSAEMNIK
jgi:lipopolysaccharide transport system ATP-binding protein